MLKSTMYSLPTNQQIYINISCMSKKERIKLLTIGKQMKELTQRVKF